MSRGPLIIFHESCSDGAGAAWAAWCKFGDAAEYRPARYGEPPLTDEDVCGRVVYMLDFAYSRAECERIAAACAEGGGSLRIIDRHKSAAADLAGLLYAHFDMTKSGAVLAWEHFFPPCDGGLDHVCGPRCCVPEVLLYIQDRDLWKWERPDSREVSAALGSRGLVDDFRALVELFGDGQVSQVGADGTIALLQYEGRILLRGADRRIASLAAIGERVRLLWKEAGEDSKWKSVDCVAVNSPRTQSEVGGALWAAAAAHGEPAIGVVWYRDGRLGKYRVSLRSTGDLDVSEIARSFGGGGHLNASGFECEELPWTVLK